MVREHQQQQGSCGVGAGSVGGSRCVDGLWWEEEAAAQSGGE